MDLVKELDCTKIEFIWTGNNRDSFEEDKEMLDSLISYAKLQGKSNGSQKIKIDVHGNLRRYNSYIEQYGFKLTGKKCDDNPYWVEAEMSI